jgi:hypothetical protein
MKYVVQISVTTTSTKLAPVTGSVNIPVGIIRKCQLNFSPGVNGSVQCAIYLGSTQIFPSDASSQYTLFVSPYPIEDEYPNRVDSTALTLKGWASGARYQHQLILTAYVEGFDQPELTA